MVEILDKKQIIKRKEEIISAIKAGKIFIYPTDTIYGMGCDATNEMAVRKIREIKNRNFKPFSVIAPSKEWILANYDILDESKLDLIPGPYTLILKMKDKNVVAHNVSYLETLGVRIPDNWFAEVISDSGLPFVTTSVNLSGQKNMEKIEDVPKEILDSVDYVIYDGPIFGKQSIRIDLTE